MRQKHNLRLVGLLLLFLLGSVGFTTIAQEDEEFTPAPYRVVGYYLYYNVYGTDFPQYLASEIPVQFLTHLVYAYIDISDNGQCVSSDEWADTGYPYPGDGENERLRGNFKQLQILDQRQQAELTLMMSIGGWENSPRFPMVTADERARERFVRSCVTFMQRYGFEGIDIHWRYPVSGGQFDGSAADRENYNLLLEEFRNQLDEAGLEDGRLYELSIGMPATPDLYQNYDLPEIIRYVDFINLHSYGYAGSWSTMTEHISPLFMSASDPRSPETQPLYTIDGTINAFFDEGVPPEMIVVGAPFFGQSWAQVTNNDFFGLFSEPGGIPSGTRPNGTLFYRDIVRFADNPTWTRYFDPEARVPWLWDQNGRIAITYEDQESIRAKAAYVINNRLGGMLGWQLAFDDADHTLLSTMSFALNGQP